MAVCGESICHIVLGDRASERYSIVSAMLGNSKHTAMTQTYTYTLTQKQKGDPAKLIWLSMAVRPPCRAAATVGRGPDHFGQYH